MNLKDAVDIVCNLATCKDAPDYLKEAAEVIQAEFDEKIKIKQGVKRCTHPVDYIKCHAFYKDSCMNAFTCNIKTKESA